MTDRGDWIETYTGLKFHPLDPRPEDVRLADIAHALAMQCRFGGHCDRRYSVAEHCVLLSLAVPEDDALAALMHDAAEAYLIDVPRPVKRYLAGYAELEKRIEQAIAEKFGLAWPWPASVKEADTRILNDERSELFPSSPNVWAPAGEPLGVRLRLWEPWEAESHFLNRFAELIDRPVAPQLPKVGRFA